MAIHASEWFLIAFCCCMGIFCRRWPHLTLYAATAAFCEVFRAHLMGLVCVSEIVFADAVLFVLPSIVLVRACGASELRSIVMLLIVVAIALSAGSAFGGDVRSKLLILGVALAQSTGAIVGLWDEVWSIDRSLSRWAATCIAMIGLLGLGFVDRWDDVAWTGVAAHAFACFAYFVHQEPQKDQAFEMALQDGESPLSKSDPRSEYIE